MDTILGLNGLHWALLGGGIAAIGGGIGSSIGVGAATRVAQGVLAEQPERFGALLVLTALPGTQGFYGFITAILVWILFNLGGGADIPAAVGFSVFSACLPVGVVLAISGPAQSWAAQASILWVAKRKEAAGRAIIFPALVETYAVTTLVVGVFYLLTARASM
jgi:V/A-type H+-transporting ATPase subunit K